MSEARRVSVQSDIPYDLVVTQLSYIGDGWEEDEAVADEDGGESNNNEAKIEHCESPDTSITQQRASMLFISID